jgi:hypothetical protein
MDTLIPMHNVQETSATSQTVSPATTEELRRMAEAAVTETGVASNTARKSAADAGAANAVAQKAAEAASTATEAAKTAAADADRANDMAKKAATETGAVKETAIKAAADAETANEAAKKTAAEVAEISKQATATLAESQTKLNEIRALATQAIAANTKITDHQAVVATKSEHIQKAQEHADTVRANLDRALTTATQQVTTAEGHKNNAQGSAEAAAKLLADIRTAKGAAENEVNAIQTVRKSAEESAAETKGVAKIASEVETRIAEYERKLAIIEQRCDSQLKTIEELLRGATSAGLATAFDKRRQTFLKPRNIWQLAFVGSLVLLVILAATGLWHVYGLTKTPEWGELARLWLSRLPIAGALVWLAMHASREAALAKRLEEDYGYKAAVASCFEGFRKQMSDIDKGLDPNSQLAKLCGNTLAAIANPPGRIYSEHKLIISPAAEIADAAKSVASVLPVKQS